MMTLTTTHIHVSAIPSGCPRGSRKAAPRDHRISVAYEALLSSSLYAVVYSSSDDEGLWNGRAKLAPRRGDVVLPVKIVESWRRRVRVLAE